MVSGIWQSMILIIWSYNSLGEYTKDNKYKSFVFYDHAVKRLMQTMRHSWKVQDNKVMFTGYHRILPVVDSQAINAILEVLFIDDKDLAMKKVNNDYITYSTRKNTCGSEGGAAGNKTKT